MICIFTYLSEVVTSYNFTFSIIPIFFDLYLTLQRRIDANYVKYFLLLKRLFNEENIIYYLY